MNWGKGIIAALGAFIVFIVVLGTVMMSTNVDLVADDYYQQEISYEDEISAKKNANALAESIEINQDKDFLIVSVPEGPYNDIKLSLDRPNDDNKDLEFNIEGTKTFLIEKNKLQKGVYNTRLTFSHDDKPCQEESSIYVNK